jgi:hypothetical protein
VTWTFIYLMVFLKLPILALLWLVWWAIHQDPEEARSNDEDGGSKLRPHRHPHPRPRMPRSPRRGPHGTPAPPSPPRVRSVVARGRRVAR